jgi:HAD superfamily hydrolase (TIGR01509 family)
MNLDLVIFDCDGVLIDSEVISSRVLVELAAQNGIEFDAAFVREHFLGRSFPTVAKTLRETFARELPADFEATYRARLLSRFEVELKPTAGLLPFLQRLTVRSCVATSSSPPRVERSLELAGLRGFFPQVFTASLVSRGKPAPDLFLHAARSLDVRPERCLVIEDSRPGVEAALAAGMEVMIFTGGSHMAGCRWPHSLGLPVASGWDVIEDASPWLVRQGAPR